MNKFTFNPPTGLLDEAAFPTNPATQQEARGQVQTPMNQIRDFINDKVAPAIEGLETFKKGFDGSSKEINGYTKLPNGMILQWCYFSTATRSNFNFPMAFPNAVFGVLTQADEGNLPFKVYTKSNASVEIGSHDDLSMANGWLLAIGY